jgi:hypothetical protein
MEKNSFSTVSAIFKKHASRKLNGKCPIYAKKCWEIYQEVLLVSSVLTATSCRFFLILQAVKTARDMLGPGGPKGSPTLLALFLVSALHFKGDQEGHQYSLGNFQMVSDTF